MASNPEGLERSIGNRNVKNHSADLDVVSLYGSLPGLNASCNKGKSFPDAIDFSAAANPYGNQLEEQDQLFNRVSAKRMDLKDFSVAENKLLTGSASNDVTEHVSAYHDGGYWKPIYARIDNQQKSIWTSARDRSITASEFKQLESNEQKIEALKAKLEADGSMSPSDRDVLNRAIDANWDLYKKDIGIGNQGGSSSSGDTRQGGGSSSGDTKPGGGNSSGDSSPGSGTGSGAVGNGEFTIKDGHIVGPDGQTFIAKGIAVDAASAVRDEATILKYFPKVNTIRLVTGPDGNTYTGYNKSPAEVAQETQQFIDDMTKRGIVVEIDDHQPGDLHQPATGAALKAEEDWYANLAKANKDNPYVWFQTPNEPVRGQDKNFVNDTVAEEKGIYDAIRGTGNNNIVVAEMAANYTADKITQDPSVFSQYSSMQNVVFDYHFYEETPDYIKKRLASTAPIADTQGVIPAIIGEYGNTDGSGRFLSAAGNENLKAVQESGLGNIAWTLHNGTAKTDENQLLDRNGQLTAYGQEVADYINS